MIAIDSCVVIDLMQGVKNSQVDQFRDLLKSAQVVMAPATLTELLSDPKAEPRLDEILSEFILLNIDEGYWERTGLLRAKMRKTGRKAPLGDALIAQACIDADVALLTRDADFKAYEQIAGLKLV